ncbi:glycosyltransferase [Roseicella aquatilis]|uniref:glycosyltransferase n=1 Tax=Roseicella aquatilis TaxID=2527868 RepID=UPI00140535A8|nr:glycosyltransferase [Roseicella aquatilis]
MCHAGMGGSSRAALQLARALQRRRHQVVLISTAAPFGHVADRDPPLLLLRSLHRNPPVLPADWALRDTAGLAEDLAASLGPCQVDVAHFHYAHPFLRSVAGLRRLLGPDCPRLACTLHGTDILDLPDAAQEATANALHGLDGVTAVSQDLAARAATRLGIPRPAVIPNFVDPASAAPRRPQPRQDGPPRIVHVSNFRPVKRLPLLVEVFSRVAATTDARLWLVGDGPDRAAVQAAIAARGLAGRTTWFGVRHDVPRILAAADLALLTSAYESFSLFALEAMAASLPVLGFDVGGVHEVVGPGGGGLLLPFGDTAALAAATAELVREADRRDRMGRQACAAAAHFADAVVVPRYEALYRRLLQEPCAEPGRRPPAPDGAAPRRTVPAEPAA